MDQPAPRRRRRLRTGNVVLAAIAIPLILITLLSLEPFVLLPAEVNAGISAIGQVLIQVLAIVAAIAVVVGVLNLSGVHIRNLRRMPRGLYSLVTLVTLIAVLALRLLERAGALAVEGSDPSAVTLTVMDSVQVVIESALAGLLFFFLVYTAYRLMRRQVTIWSALFVGSMVIVLLGYVQITGLEFLVALRDWVINVPVNAGTRGLLIGIAIGTVTVAVRLIIGQDRTFRQ